MSRRAVLTLTVLGLALTALPAQAVRPPAKVCNLVPDSPTDGGWEPFPTLYSPTTEITAVDMASGARNVSLVLKLKSTAFQQTDLVKYMTATWSVAFTLGPDTFATHRHTSYTGEVVEDSMTRNSDKLGKPTVTVDATSITWTFPRSWIPQLSKSKQVFKDLRGSTSMLLATADSAFVNGMKYNDKTPSCIKVS